MSVSVRLRPVAFLAPLVLGVACLAPTEPEPAAARVAQGPPRASDGDALTIPAFGATPSARQLAWHALETCAFVHFGMNTFTDREWGEGNEDPALFAPSDFDARQWARAFVDAGVRGVILTAKHHDGFCLWPTKTTAHSVRSSPWRGGQGDVVREVADACREAGLKFGVYLSPWDRNSPLYGDSAKYNDLYAAQLTELLTGYGPLFEAWWDGACGEGPNGKRQEYDWPRFERLVRELQPNAVIFSDVGPDVRWVGNESGFAGDTCFATFDAGTFGRGASGPPQTMLNEGVRGGKQWMPAECDVSLRPGWFFHEKESPKSVDELLEIHERSIGRGAGLLLNVPADRRGRIADVDVARLREWRTTLDALYGEDLARADFVRFPKGSSERAEGPARRACDGDPSTFWAPEEGDATPTLFVPLDRPRWIERVVLSEPIELGQRITRFTLEARADGRWSEIASGTTIGRKRMVSFAAVEANAVRLRIDEWLAPPLVADVAVHAAAPRLVVFDSPTSAVGAFDVRLRATLHGEHGAMQKWLNRAELQFTLEESEVHAAWLSRPESIPSSCAQSARAPAQWSIRVERSTTLRARVVLDGKPSPHELRVDLRVYQPSDLRPPITFIRAPDAGLRYAAYEGEWTSLDALATREPVKRGECTNFDLALATREEQCALVFDGYLQAPFDGVYTLSTSSDDGSRLWIGETLLVENDGLHGERRRSGEVALAAGWHPLRVAWFNASGGRALDVRWSGPSIEDRPIEASALYR